MADWTPTIQEIVHSAQVYGWIHLPFTLIWVIKHWYNNPRHHVIRSHRYEGHKGSPFKCAADRCATL